MHVYVDDTQLYVDVYPDEGSAADQMMDCISEIHLSMEANMLKLIKWIQNSIHGDQIPAYAVQAEGGCKIHQLWTLQNIGTVLDSKLDVVAHVNQISSACYFHLRNQMSARSGETLHQKLQQL